MDVAQEQVLLLNIQKMNTTLELLACQDVHPNLEIFGGFLKLV